MISALSKGVPRVLKARAQLPINAIRANGTVPTPRKEVPFHDTWKSDDPERMAAAKARDKVRDFTAATRFGACSLPMLSCT